MTPWVTVFQMSVLYNVPANQSLRKPSQTGDKKIKKDIYIYTQVDENYNTRNNSLAHFTIIIIIVLHPSKVVYCNSARKSNYYKERGQGDEICPNKWPCICRVAETLKIILSFYQCNI